MTWREWKGGAPFGFTFQYFEFSGPVFESISAEFSVVAPVKI